jgi:hypothetical protein
MNPYKEYVMRGQKALGLNVKLDVRHRGTRDRGRGNNLLHPLSSPDNEGSNNF